MSDETKDFLDGFADTPVETETPTDIPATDATETGDAIPTGDQPVVPATPAGAIPTEDKVPLAALMGERDKRQQYERELQTERQARADLEKRLQVQTPQGPAIWEDPDGFVRQRIQAVEHQFNQRLYGALEDQMKSVHTDYDDMLAVVQEAANANPVITQQIFASANPAQAAYKLGKQISELKQMQDPAAYREKIRAEARVEFEAETAKKSAERIQVAAALPPDLSAVRSTSATAAVAAANPVDELFPR